MWAVRDGYAGLVRGDLVRAGRWDVSGTLHRGGTVLGTARSKTFRTLEGRRAAVGHLVTAEIDGLIVVGGDGSLTGADRLRAEWSEHLDALVAEGAISAELAAAHPRLRVAGLVGSIDNDFVGSDNTLGCDSALHRIVEAVDTLASTARSHQRTFVVEVMGRHCGYLAVAAAVCTGADFVLVPEAPLADWESEMCAALRAGREQGKRKSIVIVAEGACDVDGEALTAARVKTVVERELEADTRITVLGHVQRGGSPTAEDRVMGTVLGAAATDRLLDVPDEPPVVLTTAGPDIVARSLQGCVDATRAVGTALREGRFVEAFDARGPEFAELWRCHTELSCASVPPTTGPRLLFLNVGAPAPGMNAALRAFVRSVLQAGGTPLVSQEGLAGLVRGDVKALEWMDVSGISAIGSTILGTDRTVPPPDVVDAALDAHGVDGVIFVGGFEGLTAAARITRPCAVVPATISNNVPATDRSVGCDTATNAIVEAVDRLKLSARGSRKRAFVVEVMGRSCGYLATVGSVASGAERTYTHESGLDLARLREDAALLNASFENGRQVAIVLAADGALDTYDARTLGRILAAESGGRFDTRVCVLGHLQQGGNPSPRDRLTASRLTVAAVDRVMAGQSGLIGLRAGEIACTPAVEALEAADTSHRRPAQPRHLEWTALWSDLP